MYGSVEARSSAALPSNTINPSFSMMNSASSHFCASAVTISIDSPLRSASWVATRNASRNW